MISLMKIILDDLHKMEHTPFFSDIPTDQLYESPYVADALVRLSYAADNQLFAVLTSDAGCDLPKGKFIFLYV